MHARTLIILAAVAVLAALAPAQDALVLARTARIEAGRPLCLGEIARITGPGSARLGELVLIDSPEAEPTGASGWFRVELDRVRERLVAEFGEAAGVVALTGSACDVRVMTPNPAPGRPTSEPVRPAAAQGAEGLVGEETVRGAVARELSRILQTPPRDLRLGFDEGDREFLDTPTVGKVIEISPTGSSERMPVAVAVYDPSGRVSRKTVRIKVEAHRPVAVVARAMARGAVIGRDDITAEVRWLPPSDRVVSPVQALGSVARRRLDPGETLESHCVEPPVMIHRGDVVSVRVVTAGLVVRREGNAMEDGCEGEVIEFAARFSPKQRFLATVLGHGEAVVWAGPRPGTGLAMIPGAG